MEKVWKKVCVSVPERYSKKETILTPGKIYEFIKTNNMEYEPMTGEISSTYFIGDDGKEHFIWKGSVDYRSTFISLEEHRSNQLNKIGI
jgi:hypothetical protein